MIPKNIIQIWIGGKVPDKYLQNIESVKKLNPDWQYTLYDEAGIREAIKSLGENYLSVFDNLKLLHQKVDYGRYALLYKFGGASVDVDAIALKGFDETPGLGASDFIVSKNSNNQFINNATILVSKKNLLMKDILDGINPDCSKYIGETSCILNTTGPYYFTNFLNNHLNEISVLNNKYFEPCSGYDKNCTAKPETIILHQHEGTWVNPFYKTVLTTYHNIRPYRIIIFVILLLIVLYIIFKKLL